MSADQPIMTQFNLTWCNINLKGTYILDYFSQGEFSIDHIEIAAKEPLPITDTGYRSHFVSGDAISYHGGVKAYVLAWLEDTSNSDEWRRHLAEKQQPSLFD